MPSRAARIICAIALVSGLAACSTSNGSAISLDGAASRASTTGPPMVADVPQVVASLHLRLPLDDYLPSIDDLNRIGLARRQLLSECLLHFGFDVQLPEPVTGIGIRSWTERRYGLSDADQAAVSGYGLGERDPEARGGEPEEPRLNPAVLALLTGEEQILPNGQQVPAGGCSGQAQRALSGSTSYSEPVDTFLAQQLSQDSFERSRRDPRVLDAFALWSDCMRSQGHAYADPLAPFSDSSLGGGSTPEAIDIAIDDVECKASTNVTGIWYAVESAYQEVSIDENRAGLTALATANARTADLVAQVLSDS